MKQFLIIAGLLLIPLCTYSQRNTGKARIANEVRAVQIKELKFGMFICWSFSTFYGQEWTPTLDKDASFFKAKAVDTDQWCRLARDAGMNYILFLSKHHDGFCLWDTKTTDKKVTNSPLGVDVLKELRKSCDKYGIKLALYFSEGDWNWPGAVDGKGFDAGKGVNPEMKKAQLKELCTKYGPIEFFWMDHAVGDGGLNHEMTVRWIQEFQPNCFVGFNHGEPAGRLSLREMGTPGNIGDTASTVYNKDAEGTYDKYLVAEFTYPILPPHAGGAMWFYSLPEHDSLVLPAEKIFRDYQGAVKYGNIFSLNVGPDYDGRIRDIDVKTLNLVGRYIRGDEKPRVLSLVAAASATPQQPNLTIKNVVVVFKTHFDIGYTDLAGSVVKKYQTSMIEGALKEIDRSIAAPGNEHFTWTLPAWPMQQILSGSAPETKNRVIQALRNKYLAVHALPFTIETEASDLENLARIFQSSSDISREYGLPLPRDAKMTDVPEHTWVLPTILANAGIRFLHLGCNAASQSPEVPDLFWWEGPDGSRVLTFYNPKYYGTDIVPPSNWPYRTWIAIMHTNDNIGAPAPEVVEKTLADIKRLNPNARISLGRMSDFYDLIIKENADIPVVRKDMPDTWIHGYMSMPREVKNSRRIKKDMFTLDMLNSQLNLWKSEDNDISVLLKKAVENSLLFDEHTFGLAMSHGHSGNWCYGDAFRTLKTEEVFEPIEFSWKEKSLRILDAERIIRPELNDKLKELSYSVDIKGAHITVYNPLPWKRDGVVKLQIHSNNLKTEWLKDEASGEIIHISNQDNVIRFIATDIPPMGYKSYIPVDTAVPEKTSLRLSREHNTIENDYLKITIDSKRGGLGSVIDKRSGHEMVKTGSEYVFGGYVYERFSKENTDGYAKDYIKGGWDWAPAELGRPNLTGDAYRKVQPTPVSIYYEADNNHISAVMQFNRNDQNPHDYTMIYTLYENLPYIEIQWGIMGKSPDPWPEAGWISFPFYINDATFRLGRLGSIVDPAKDYAKGSNLDYCFLNSGMAVLGKDNRGYGISSPDVPGISLDRPGLWKYSTDFIPRDPSVFFNLYNNQWSTNFTEWIEGSWSAKFYIWTIDDYTPEKDLITPAEEMRVPLLAGFSSNGNGSIPASAIGIEVSMKGVMVTAFGKNPDGEGLILRLWEQAGNSGKCIVNLPNNLNGRK